MFNTKSDLTLIIFTAPALSTLLYAMVIFLFFRSSDSKRALGELLLVVGLCMIAFLISDFYIYSAPYAINRFFDSWSGLLISPFVMNYFSTLVSPHQWNKRKLFIWLLPAAVFLPLYLLVIALWGEYPATYNWKIFLQVIYKPEPLLRLTVLAGFALMFLVGCTLVFRMAREHILRIRNDFSYEENINLYWVAHISWLLALFGVFAILGIVTSEFGYKTLFSLVSFIIMLVIFILGVKQAEIPAIEIKIDKTPSNGRGPTTKEKLQELKIKMITYFEKEQLYLNPDLDLNKLAEVLNTNRTYISNIINGEFETTFYLFVNRYRIRHAAMLIELNEMSVDTIVTESGFKSRSSFYKMFRQEMGCSPTEYISKGQETRLAN